MSDSITVPTRRVEVPAPAVWPEIVPLDRALESIRADSLKRPDLYLEETEVPDGGE